MILFGKILIAIFYLALIVFAAWKLCGKEEEEPELIYTFSLHKQIERIAETDKEIQLIDDMLINLSTADHPIEGDCLRSMEVYWDWGGKLGQQAPFPVAKGTATAKAMRNLAEVRRGELVQKLAYELAALPSCEKQENSKTS